MLSNFLKGFNKLAGHSNSRSPGDKSVLYSALSC